MMNPILSQVIKDLRSVIVGLRQAHCQVLKQHPPKPGQKHRRLALDGRREIRPIQAQLQVFVPLLRTMAALFQQSGKQSLAEHAYRKKFRALELLLVEATRDESCLGAKLLSQHPGLSVWVPGRLDAPVQWASATLKELYDQKVEEVRIFRVSAHERSTMADTSRQRFLESLSKEQADLLFTAINQSRAAGAAGLLLLPSMVLNRQGALL